ncbi:NAD(P)-dependent oxidoreductase [Brevibacillus sp. SYP-B805]|uniref:NAD(P)-dependent oxidoreductase n=1 Tax=Brevibacillus sp. SYP-B805 TaxID=1578199 RepID=UPI0013ED424B|nr:NAD(P)-dependent oxidoreductase [Brevibacillus sp. SYP-B805]NGQ97377.1 NAD(P)-dependent oxidoreductase [Brevibacillus sp. SYP-B805]
MKIGWIGLGHMGNPMAANLLKAGHEVTVWNRSREKAEPLLQQGARMADRPAELMESCDVVISMVSDDEAVKEVYLGQHGLLHGQAAGKIAIDMSTISPATSRYLAERCRERGVSFLDAPVSGSVQPAREGTLIIMVGGERKTYEQVKPLFDVLGKMSLYLGDNGSGSKAKLAINLLLGITVQGLAETMLYAKKQGIDPRDMLTIITESAVGTPIARGKAPLILENRFPSAFPLKHMAKDLRLVHETGASSPLAESVYASYRAALDEGLGDQDVMAILRYLAGDIRS